MNYFTFPGIIRVDYEKTLKASLLRFCKENERYKYISSWDQVAIAGKRNRKGPMINIRQMYHYLMKRNTSLTLTEIGQLTGGHDHTTVIYSIQTVANHLDTKDPDTIRLYNYLNT